MDKTEFPTPARLAELRLQGNVAVSRYAAAAISALAVLLCLWGEYNSLLKIWKIYLNLFADENVIISNLSTRRQLTREVLQVLFLPALAVAIVIFISGFLQTRFLVKLDLIAINFERCWRGIRLSFAGFVRSICVLIAATLAAALFFGIFSPQLWALLNQPTTYLQLWASKALPAGVPVVSMFLALSALCAIVFTQVWFRMQNLMSRREIEQDEG